MHHIACALWPICMLMRSSSLLPSLPFTVCMTRLVGSACWYTVILLILQVSLFSWLAFHEQPEGHLVERMYLRQRCFDGSVNITILKSRLAAAAGRQYTYTWDFPDVKRKIPRTSTYTISEKAIRFRHPDYNPDRAQKFISSSMSRHLSTRKISSKSMHAFLSNLANRQTNERGQKYLPLSEVKNDRSFSVVLTVGQVDLLRQVLEAIQRGIDVVNKTSTSRAQCIQKWSILRRDFSVFGGELGQFVYLHWLVVVANLLLIYFRV